MLWLSCHASTMNVLTPLSPAKEEVAGEGDGGDARGKHVQHRALVKGAHCRVGVKGRSARAGIGG